MVEEQVGQLASGGQKKWQTFFAKRNLGGNFLNWYHPARAPRQDKQFFNLCGVDNTSLLIHYCSILYSNASKMHLLYLLFCGSNLRSFRQEFSPRKKRQTLP